MSFDPIKINKLQPLNDHVLVRDMNFGERQLSSKIVLMGDDGKSSGIRPRWAKVFAVGPAQKDIAEGQWILVAHGRWTRGSKIEVNGEVMVIRRVDNNDILLVSDEPPADAEIISEHA
jgi:co-chaperonin GroES (HSP10)